MRAEAFRAIENVCFRIPVARALANSGTTETAVVDKAAGPTSMPATTIAALTTVDARLWG